MLKKIIILFSIVYSITGFAAESALEQLDAMMAPIHLYQARFNQVIRNQQGSSLQRSSGMLIMQRPDQFRWEVKKPITQIIIAHGNELAIYDPDLQQVILKRLNRVASDAPALLLSRSFKKFANEFNVSMKIISSQEVQFTLTPRDANTVQQFDRVVLIFKNRKISGMRLTDQYNHQTSIEFSDVRVNAALPKNSFIIPRDNGIDIIDTRK